jgi:hypothetical protein
VVHVDGTTERRVWPPNKDSEGPCYGLLWENPWNTGVSHLRNFLTRVAIRDGQPGDYDQLDRAMYVRRFFRHIVGADKTPYFLPPATYFSFGDLPAVAVRNLADEAAKTVGKPHVVVTVAVIPSETAWTLDKILPELPPMGAQPAAVATIALPTPGDELLERIQQTMDKIRPLAETTAKVSSDFGQILIKGCTTLNAGALITLPAFYKALVTGNAPTPRAIYIACAVFAAGLAAGALAGWAAFVFTSQATRMLTRSLQMPMLKTQQTLYPATMDRMQLKRLAKAEFSTRWVEAIGTLGLWVVSLASLVSVCCIIAGAYYGASATLSLTGR